MPLIPHICRLFAVIGIALQIAFVIVENKKKYLPAVILKGLASLMFVLYGVCAGSWISEYYSDTIAKYIIIGLILGAIGDILLNLRFCVKKGSQAVFFAGIAAFLAGHVFYIMYAGKQIIELLPTFILIGIVLAAIILILVFTKLKDIKISFKIFGAVYIGIVSVMTSVAVGCVFEFQTAPRILFAIGAVFFLVSDVVMVFNTFGKQQRFSLRVTNLMLYYIGQLLIGTTLRFFEYFYG